MTNYFSLLFNLESYSLKPLIKVKRTNSCQQRKKSREKKKHSGKDFISIV